MLSLHIQVIIYSNLFSTDLFQITKDVLFQQRQLFSRLVDLIKILRISLTYIRTHKNINQSYYVNDLVCCGFWLDVTVSRLYALRFVDYS